MAAGTCVILGPYSIGDTSTAQTDITTQGGAVAKQVSAYLDAQQKVYFVVTTQA